MQQPFFPPCAMTLSTCCRCQSRCSHSKLYYHKRGNNLPQNELKTNVLASKKRKLEPKTEKWFVELFVFFNFYLVKFILWRRQALLSMCSNHAIFLLLFEIFQKFFFSLVAKTFVHLQNNKFDGYRKYCTLGDSSSDSHSFWDTLYIITANRFFINIIDFGSWKMRRAQLVLCQLCGARWKTKKAPQCASYSKHFLYSFLRFFFADLLEEWRGGERDLPVRVIRPCNAQVSKITRTDFVQRTAEKTK